MPPFIVLYRDKIGNVTDYNRNVVITRSGIFNKKGHDLPLSRISDVAQDRAAIEANMADDFRQIDGDGDVEDKASFLEGILSPRLVIHPYAVEDFDVRLYGDVALLSGRTRMTGAYDGKPWSSHYRYVDVYVRRNGRWQVANVQISRIRPTP